MKVQIVTEEERFEYTPEGCEPTVFVLRRLTQEAVEEIDQRYRRKVTNRRTGQTDYVIPPHLTADRIADIYDYVIVDWRHVAHPTTGEDLPCERAWKKALPASVKVAIMEQVDGAH